MASHGWKATGGENCGVLSCHGRWYFRPAVFPNQGNELAGTQRLCGEFVAMLKNQLQFLMLALAHGDHQAAAARKLVEQRLRYFGWRSRTDHNYLVTRGRRIALSPVPAQHLNPH